jgi:hypothetical protein
MSCHALFQFQVRFLLELSEARDANKMDARSLAIVLTPCIFSVEEDDFSGQKSSDSKSKSFDTKLEVVKTLIINAHKVKLGTGNKFSFRCLKLLDEFYDLACFHTLHTLC